MNKKLNNQGFTLVELLAVLAILIAIMAIAIPSISSSLERTKAKQNESRKRVIESAAELYVADHKNAIYKNLENNGTDSCYILISDINYLTDEEMKDADGEPINGYVIFKKPNSYDLAENNTGLSECYDGITNNNQGTNNDASGEEENSTPPKVTCIENMIEYDKENFDSSYHMISFNPPLNITSVGLRYFGSGYTIDSENQTFNLTDTVNNTTFSGYTNFFLSHPYVCIDNSGNYTDVEKTSCKIMFEILDCESEDCDGMSYIGNYYTLSCS